MNFMRHAVTRICGWTGMRLGVLLLATLIFPGLAVSQALSTTTVQGTVYLANGQTGAGTLTISWPAFTTAAGQAVAASRTTLTIGSDGFVSVNLAPNQGATPAGLYYTAIYHLSDGTASTEYWMVPAAAQATLGDVRTQVMPAAQAVQAVSKAYVDQSISELTQSLLTASGGNLNGALYLNGDPTQPTQAADKHYVDSMFGQSLPLAGGAASGPLTATQLGAANQVDQLNGADFGAKLQTCIDTLNSQYGGTCDARNFSGTLSMASSVTIAKSNVTILLPCATIATANQFIVTAGTRNASLRGCSLRGGSAASGNQGGTVFQYSGVAAMIQVGDTTYAVDTPGFHMDNAVLSTTSATSATAQGMAAYRTQELDLESLYFLGNSNQSGITLDGTGNYTGGTFFDDTFNGFQTAVNGIGHQAANSASTDWVNASTFVRLHIDCPTSGGNPISGTTGINLVAGDGNTFTGGDVEGCATALHLGASAQNNTIIGLRNENSSNQVVADAGSAYNNWITGGTLFTGKLTDNGTRNSFLDTFHRSFNALNGDWYGSQQDATLTNHYRLGTGTGNERGLLNRYQTDSGYRWTTGISDATAGEQFYQVLDELNNVYRLSIGQYNNGQPSTNDQTVINAAGSGAVVLNGSNNAGTGGVVVGSGGPSETTVATISNTGNAQFNGTLQVGGLSTFSGSTTVRNQADAEVDAFLWAGATANQKESFIYKDYTGASQWYLVKDANNNWALNSATGGLDSFKAYQSNNSGDTYINASNATGHIRLNYEAGAGAETDIYSGSNASLAAAFQSPTSIKLPGLSAGSGHNCLQIDNSGYISNTGAACGAGGSGTVNSASSGQIAYYTSNGTAIGGMSAVPVAAGGTGAQTAVAAVSNLLPGVSSDSASGIKVNGSVAAGTTNPTTLGNTFTAQYNSSQALAASLGNVLANQPAVNANLYTSIDTVHGGTDYGAALNAAIAAQPLLQLSTVTEPTACQPVWNPIIVDRPVTLRDLCLVPQAGGAGGVWGATPTVLSSVVLTPNTSITGTPTAGSTTFTVPGGCAALPSPPAGTNYEIAVGGIGIVPDTYIASCAGSTATLSEPAAYSISGLAGGTSITYANTVADLTTSNTLTPYNYSAVTISGINYANNTLSLSSSTINMGNTPQSFAVGGALTTTLTVEVVAPVITFAANSSALTKVAGGQNIGGGLEDVTILDPASDGASTIGRTLTGVQGIQIYHWDQLSFNNYRCNGLLGSCLILGGGGAATIPNSGNNPVRESFFSDMKLRESGDPITGQSTLVIASPASVDAEDEINQIGFKSLQVVFARATAVHVTTHNTYHQAEITGPREIWIDGPNSQLEAGGYNDPTHPLPPCADLVRLSYAVDFYYSGGEINGADCGFADIGVTHTIQHLTVTNSDLKNSPPPVTWTVGVTAGSRAITYVSGGVTPVGGSTNFGVVDGEWNGRWVQIIDGTVCTTASPCNFWLDPSNAQTSTTALQLPSGVTYPSGYTGNATMQVVSGGAFYAARGPIIQLWSTGNFTYGVTNTSPTYLNLVSQGVAISSNLALTGSAINNYLNCYCHDFLAPESTALYAISDGSLTCGSGGFNGQLTGLNGVSGRAFGALGTQTISATVGTVSSHTGGPSAGAFVSGTTGTLTVTITPGGSAASHGWTCPRPTDQTTPGNTASWQQTGNTTTTITLSGTATSGDTIVWGPCGFY